MHLSPGVLSSVVTIVWFLAFIALWMWAWSGRRRKDYEAAARLPLEETSEPPAESRAGGH